MAQEKCTGVVNWFSNQKGFGFIKPSDGGEDLFVHQTSIVSDGFRSLGEGDAVEFDIVLGDDGRSKAVDVALLDRSAGGRRRDSYSRGSRSAVGGGGFGGGWRSGGGGGGDRGGYGRNGGGACYNCGQPGHMARECTRGGGGGGSGCYNCGDVGHIARDCTASAGGGGGACFSCGQVGHMARECPQAGGGGGSYGRFGSGGGSRGGCYNCGGQGHIARECPNNV